MSKKIRPAIPIQHPQLLLDLFETYRPALGPDFDGYRNHCLRMCNYCLAFCGLGEEHEEKCAIAAVFHDLGIWTDRTFDYLPRSMRLASAYLQESGRNEWIEEIVTMVSQHHKLKPYQSNPLWLVEPFRKADLVDISGGLIRYDLNDDFVSEVLDTFPNAGFHKTLLRLTWKRMKSHPFDPLPMMKW
jgi:hypothetical protein